jgi:predicted permease
MRSLKRFFTRVVNTATRRKQEERLREEIAEHIALQTAENLRGGLSPVEARRQAMLKFGGLEAMKEDYRAEGGLLWIENLVRDLRFAVRMLRKSPSITAVAIVTLALSIGANALVFGILNALILRPLNVPHEESLYQIEPGDHNPPQSYPNYLDLRDRNRSFETLGATSAAQAGLDTGETASPVWVGEVSGNSFDGLGIQPYLGRFFHASDEHGPNSAPYIVLSYAYWHTHFQDDRGVVGRTVQLNKHPFTIIGVTPPGYHGLVLFFYPDLYVPIVNEEQLARPFVLGTNLDLLNARGSRWVSIVGRLKAGVTPDQAIADLNSIGSWLEKTYPQDDGKMSFVLARPALYGDLAERPIKAFLTGLMLLAGLILLAACANLGSLFAARAADRSREVALRLALGASRMRILRQLFTESVLLSLMGGAVGLWGSVLLLRGLSVWQPFSRFPVHVAVNPDTNVYAVALLLTLASGFLFGAVPIRQVLHADPYQIVKAGSLGKVGRRISVRDLLLVGQIAICAVLVTSSMVAVRGLLRSLHSNFGFDVQKVMLADTDLNMAGYRGDNVPAMQRRMIDAMATMPGVTSVGLVDRPPLDGTWKDSNVFTDETTDLRPSNAAASPVWYGVSPEYFHAAGTALLSGKAFTWHDDRSAPRVAVVNAEFAREVFGSVTDAIGKHYRMPDGGRVRVVGIVEDGKYKELTEAPQPAMFFSLLQSPSSVTSLVVRSSDPQQVAAAMRRKLRELDSGLPCYIQPWEKALDIALFGARMATLSLGVLGVMGAMLSVTGIFGMAAYSVSKRLRELGIRIALGAQRQELLQAALGRPFKLLAFGSAAGLILGILASRVLDAIVALATPRDPLVLAGVLLAMSLLGLLATWIPARRALSIDPMILLHEE